MSCTARLHFFAMFPFPVRYAATVNLLGQWQTPRCWGHSQCRLQSVQREENEQREEEVFQPRQATQNCGSIFRHYQQSMDICFYFYLTSLRVNECNLWEVNYLMQGLHANPKANPNAKNWLLRRFTSTLWRTDATKHEIRTVTSKVKHTPPRRTPSMVTMEDSSNSRKWQCYMKGRNNDHCTWIKKNKKQIIKSF